MREQAEVTSICHSAPLGMILSLSNGLCRRYTWLFWPLFLILIFRNEAHSWAFDFRACQSVTSCQFLVNNSNINLFIKEITYKNPWILGSLAYQLSNTTDQVLKTFPLKISHMTNYFYVFANGCQIISKIVPGWVPHNCESL